MISIAHTKWMISASCAPPFTTKRNVRAGTKFGSECMRACSDAIVASEQARMHSDPNFVPARTFLLVVNGGAQEAEIIHFVWAMLIILYKWLLLRRERKLLDRDLIHVPEGIKVLPEDAKDYARQLEQLAGREGN